MTSARQLTAALTAASHAVQVAFHNHMEARPEDEGRELEVLATLKPVALTPDRVSLAALNAPLWSDAEVIVILTDAAEVDRVTDRPLGTWEIMRLQQRDMIRKALIKA